MAHLVFADTQANAKKPNEPFFSTDFYRDSDIIPTKRRSLTD